MEYKTEKYVETKTDEIKKNIEMKNGKSNEDWANGEEE